MNRTPPGLRVHRYRTGDQRPGNHPLPAALRLLPRDRTLAAADPLGRDPVLARLEAAFFLADEPLTLRKLMDICGFTDAAAARRAIERLKTMYDMDGTAFQIEEIAGGYQVLTRAVYHSWLLRFRQSGQELRLSASAMETLAIVAYKQPLTRADIEQIRGVQCADLLRLLMEKGLIRVTGRHDSLGRPQLYGTTRHFLQVMGLKSIQELPTTDLLPYSRKT